MSRIEQINTLLARKLGILISQEIPMDNGMITITYVDCSPDLKNAKIYITILPQNLAGTALKKLKQNNAFFGKEIAKSTRLRKVPKFEWVIDRAKKEAYEIEETLSKIRNE